MKKYWKELLILLVQLAGFYLLPLFAGPTDMMGLVVLLLLLTAAVSLVLGIWSKNKIKFFYPPAAALLFLPSVFIYYNETALIHGLWYLVVSALGLGIGSLICKLLRK